MGTNHSTSRAPVARGVPVAHGAPAPPAPAPPAPPATETATGDDAGKVAKLDLVFTMDCTGSMGSYITAAKTNIEAIVARLAAAEGYDLRFGLVAYRDHPPQDHTYVTKSFGFTSRVSEMRAHLHKLSAAGGGDGPEAVAAGLKATLEQDWRDDATKVSILIADAPPHGLGERGDGFPDGAPDGVDPLAVLDQMSAKGICVYSVGCQPALSNYRYATDFFIACAERTNGQAVALGSAAALADVIMGGAIEEMDLEKLADEMRTAVQQLQQADPAMAEEELQERVWHGMRNRGCATRQMKTAKLSSASAQLVSKAGSLSAAKSALAAAGPPPPAAPAWRGGALLKKRCAAPSRSSRVFRSEYDEGVESDGSEDDAAAFSDEAPAAKVALEKEEISMEQVSRLYGRGKKKGMW